MRGERTSVVQGAQEANVNDLKLPAINVERLTQSRLSRPRVDQSYAVIASVPVEQRSKEPETRFPLTVRSCLLCRKSKTS